MANNQLYKWLIGLSSVALFTGLVGISQQSDQATAAQGKNQANDDANTINKNSQDDFKQQMANNEQSLGDQQQTDQESNPVINQDQPNSESDNFAPSTHNRHSGRIRTRAS